MSSPSSSASSKRKRAGDVAIPQSSTIDLLQPSSRDASEEAESEAPAAQQPPPPPPPPTTMASAAGKHKKAATSTDSANPPAKRAKTRSDPSHPDHDASHGAAAEDGGVDKEDPGEPSVNTGGRAEIEPT